MAGVDGQIVLGLNINATTAQISADLDKVLSSIGKKEIILSAKIDSVNNDNVTKQINNLEKQLDKSLNKKDIKFNVGIEQNNINRIKKELSELKIGDTGAKELTKELTAMNVGLEKVQHKWVDVTKAEDDGTESTQRLLNLMIQGSTEQGKLVTLTKQFNTETGEVVKSQIEITDNIKAQQKEQESLAKKQRADNDARIKYLSEQKSLLANIEAAYTGKTSAKGVKNESHLNDLKKQYDEIKATISQLEHADGALSQKQKSDIASQIADLKRLAKEYQNTEYVATQLRTKDISPIKEEQLSKLAQFESDLERAGTLTNEFKSRITDLTGQLANAFNKESLTTFLNNFDLLKLDAQSFKQDMAGLETQFKQLETVDSKISGIRQRMVGTKDSSNEYQAMNQQLQLQYEQRRKIASEIEKTATLHPELIQHSQELSNLLSQSAENAAKLATEEAKVADQIANTANSYREQASNNTFENNINALETRFQSLKDVSGEAAASMQGYFADLRSLTDTIATSADNAQVINTYDQYNSTYKKASNDLQMLERNAKASANALKDVAHAQNTLMKSATLSNKMETWMNDNEKAAKRYGDRIRELQAVLANNEDPKFRTSANIEFSQMKTEARAAGLTTNQFAKSLKNMALDLVGISSAVDVVEKVISGVKDGVDTVIELDTALVDLKKTTTMSGSDLNAFYKDANKAAIELGVTTKDIIQSASDWSRLNKIGRLYGNI